MIATNGTLTVGPRSGGVVDDDGGDDGGDDDGYGSSEPAIKYKNVIMYCNVVYCSMHTTMTHTHNSTPTVYIYRMLVTTSYNFMI